MYAGKKGLPRKLFASFQLSERIPENNFYRRLKGALNLDFFYPLTKLLQEEHRPCGVLQALFGRVPGKPYQRSQAYRALFDAFGHPLLRRLRYRRGTPLAQYDKPHAAAVPRSGLRGNLHKDIPTVRRKGYGKRGYPGQRPGAGQ